MAKPANPALGANFLFGIREVSIFIGYKRCVALEDAESRFVDSVGWFRDEPAGLQRALTEL